MKMTLEKFCVAAACSVAISFVAGADEPAPIYATEVTNAWYSVDVSALDALATPPWTMPSSGTATISEGKIVLSQADALKYAPAAAPASPVLRMVTTITPTVCDEAENVANYSTAQAAIYILDDGNALCWKALSGANFVTLAGLTPEANTSYDFKVEFRYSDKKIRYSVKATNDSTFNVLKSGETEWLDNHVAASTGLATIVFKGTCSLGDFYGVGVSDKAEVTPEGGVAIDVDANWLTEKHIDANDPAAVKAFLEANGENGRPNWQNYALGIENATATDLPIVKAVQNSNLSKIAFKMLNGNGGTELTGKDGSKVAVTYCVEVLDSPTAASGTDSDSASAGSTLEIDLPSDKVKYYRLKINFAAQSN